MLTPRCFETLIFRELGPFWMGYLALGLVLLFLCECISVLFFTALFKYNLTQLTHYTHHTHATLPSHTRYTTSHTPTVRKLNPNTCTKPER
jgi:hypothetical protein